MDEKLGDNALLKAGQSEDDQKNQYCTTMSTSINTSVPSGTPIPRVQSSSCCTFLQTISNQHTRKCKYPNPDVPEFYPRGISYLNACANKVEQTSQCIAYNTNVVPKSDLVLTEMSQQRFASMNVKSVVEQNRDIRHGVTHYYWTLQDPSQSRIPRMITYKQEPLQIDIEKPKPVDLQSELNKKDRQLIHLNNVVKALLEEIWRINESLIKYKNREQWKTDMTFAINEFLKPSSDLGFHCDDCCDKFKEYVIKVFKQQERKIAKQQAQYKDTFINYLISVIANSLESLNKSCTTNDEMKPTQTKLEIGTQTDDNSNSSDQRNAQRRSESRRAKQQMTKIYRNRNFCKSNDTQNNANFDPNWYPYQAAPYNHQNKRSRNKSQKHFQPSPYSPQTYKSNPRPHYESYTTNPVQLIHQKYKNLNCRLEGIPDKNLVKFSYIVNGKEYSAIASTKKEAQYHCAWHVLGAMKQE